MKWPVKTFYGIELTALVIGIVGGLIAYALTSWFGSLPQAFTGFFRLGTTGARFLVNVPIVVLIGCVIFLINLFAGLRRLWSLRLIGFLLCFFSLIFYSLLL